MVLTIVYGTASLVPKDQPIVNDDRVRLYVAGDRTYVGEETTDTAHVCDKACLGRIIDAASAWAQAGTPRQPLAWEEARHESWYTYTSSYVATRKLTLGDIERVSTADVTDFDPGDDPYVKCSACGAELHRDDQAFFDQYGHHIGDEHIFGEWERSHFAGTPHRKCTIVGCRVVSLDGDED